MIIGTSALLFGQSDRGTITGIVTDPSGAVIPDATVTVINASTNARSVVLSTSSGSYTVPQLTTGTYKISVEKQGFKTAVRENLPLLLGQTVREDIGLEVVRAHKPWKSRQVRLY